MMRRPAALTVSGLSARYGSTEVLRGVDLCIQPGEIFGLLGPNGAGKTSLVRAICGRLPSTAGSVTIAGRCKGRSAFGSIGIVPQEIALYPSLTIYENLEVFGRLSGLSRKEIRPAIEASCEAANLIERLGERIEHLSGGWKRRVNIVAAILHRPALLILDEPAAGVDLDARNGLHHLIRTVSSRGMGILLITHDLHQAELLCTRVGFLLNKTLSPQGPPRVLLDAEFAGQGELIIEFSETLSANQATILRRLGFVQTSDGQNWHLVSDRSFAHLVEKVERTGLTPREMHFTKPGLDSLFLQLLHQPSTTVPGAPA